MSGEDAALKIDVFARQLSDAGCPEATTVLMALAAAFSLGPQGVESLNNHVRYWTTARLNVMPPIRPGRRPRSDGVGEV